MKQLCRTKRTFFIILLCAVGIVGTATTYAILTSATGTITNSFLPGEVNTHIEEEFEGTVEAGAVVKKTPAIRNEGPSNAWIRARITVTPADTPLEFLYGTWDEMNFTKDNAREALGIKEGILYNKGEDERGWYFNTADGFYYFNMVTSLNEGYNLTDTLFDAVKIGENVTNNFDVTVYQEAVYADGLEEGTIIPADELTSVAAKFNAVTKEK